MAEASSTLDPSQFSCAICLDLLKDPVTIPCGHSYCMKTFTPRPVLGRNTILVEVVEKLKKTGLQAATPADHYAGPGDVECDVCTGRKHKAVKSCLVCLASYCETHLQPHYESPAFKKHKLTDAAGRLQDNVCSQNDKHLEVYCRTDQQCVCYLRTTYEHRGHDRVSAAARRAEKQVRTETLKYTAWPKIRSAQSAVQDNERTFTEMIRSIERRCSEVTKLIRDQEKAAVSLTEGHMERLKQEIDELTRRHSELEQLSHREDHIHFLQSCQGLPVTPEAAFGPRISVSPCFDFENGRKVVSALKDQLENVCEKKTKEIRHAEQIITFLSSPPSDYCQLTLDSNTANEELRLSKGNRVVTMTGKAQLYPDHQERFDVRPQVLCTEGLTGCCYWEVEWSGRVVAIAVTYKGINRKGEGDDSRLGYNDKSWRLYCSGSSYSFQHNKVETAVSGPPSSRIGVYLDHRAGTLSFYSVSDTVTLLHRVQTTFTEPLYPGFVLWNSTAKLF
uniref:B30.2/SPRY domain-containing protein n=1 Tax=Paramormyrops kingsleyae TaxID=1676925 RepID=A0A3B3QDK8_9TELE